MYYYEVGLGVERHWGSPLFTYGSEEPLADGSIVRVPFGKYKRTGVVVRRVKKPSFKLKMIERSLGMELPTETRKFLDWYAAYYLADNGQTYGQFMPSYLTATPKILPEPAVLSPKKPTLSKAQLRAADEIVSSTKPSILHGITGAGKTRIYIHLIREQLKAGKNAVLLFPEIALTAQTVNELSAYVPVFAFHSQMTNAERSKLWYSVANAKKPFVVVGPRSALFLPLRNLGIIIIDEAHETSYKQENDVHYNGLHAAAGLANVYSAKLVLGSATPPVSETEYILERGGNLVCLHEKALNDAHIVKDVRVVDARNRQLFSKHMLLSDELLSAIKATLATKGQILLFINRRGTAKLMRCSSPTCTWQAECSNCDLPMTYHHDTHQLFCHTCGRRQAAPSTCPVCQSKTELRSLGTKALVDDLATMLPQARIGRFDSDTDKRSSFTRNYQAIREGEIDILIGTQQLVKGLDLPKLELVGIINADLSLHFPDFSSDERTFQLIAQALGRVGRGHAKGTAIIQTFQPSNPVMRFALREDWHGFWEHELDNRQNHKLPPYEFVAKVLFRQKTYQQAENKAAAAKKILEGSPKVIVDGPLPSFHLKRGGSYYFQLHVRSHARSHITKALQRLPKESLIDLDPLTLL